MADEVEVLFGEAAGIVRDQGEAHLVVADVDIGVVAGGLGRIRPRG